VTRLLPGPEPAGRGRWSRQNGSRLRRKWGRVVRLVARTLRKQAPPQQEASVLVSVVSSRLDALVRVLVGFFMAVLVRVLVNVLVRMSMAVTSSVGVRVLVFMRMLMNVLVHDRLLCKAPVT